jgi:diguanylate cyclase (GGDEF)-like protein
MGIYNRRYLDRRLEEEFLRARRHGLPLSVLMLDIDDFKRINDTYGHRVGDLALNHVVKMILQAKREVDIVACYGGDELLILAPNTELPAAEVFGQRLRQEIEEHQPVVEGESGAPQSVSVMVSIGVAGLEPDVSECRWLVCRADEALCRAKQEGRNRVLRYGCFKDYERTALPTARNLH